MARKSGLHLAPNWRPPKSGALIGLSEKHSLVRVEFSSAAYQTTDSDLSLFSNLKNNISHLDLSKTKISDQALGTVQGYRNLVWLSLRNTQIGDRGLESLAKMEELTYINLVGTKVTDKGLESLSSSKTWRRCTCGIQGLREGWKT